MQYKNLSVLEFIRKSKAGEIDLQDFYAKLRTELEKLNKKYNFLIKIASDDICFNRRKLAGLPVSVKDCICTKGLQSTAGSRILEGYIPPFNATVVEKIKNEGGVIIGKTNQDEFGFGTFGINSGFGPAKNPYDATRSCGGSSSGAAGLTAALEFPHIALSESTGGSISCPASFCGVFGLTPTYGLVSRYGLIDYANSMDKIGVMGKRLEDCALMLSIIAGKDEKDSTTIKKKYEDYLWYLKNIPKKLKIGIPKEYFKNVNPQISKLIWKQIKKLESLGIDYKEVSLKLTKQALAAYYIIACSESSTNLAKFCGMRYGASEPVSGHFNEYFAKVRTKYFGTEAKRRILLGTFARMAGYKDKYYLKAMQVRTKVINEFKQNFKKFDALIAPTMPIIAPKFSEIEKMKPIEHYLMDILTVAPNMAGIPQLNVPVGKIGAMPVGLHILGDYLQEGKILQVGKLVKEK